jgi:hypothetical protein
MVPRRLSTARLTLPAVVLSTLIGLALAAAGCVKTPLVAPSGTVITLIPTTNVLPVNGSADIIALLIEQGTTTTPPAGGGTPAATPASGVPVHNGTVVTFTTTLGKVEPAEAKTNAGQVTVKLLADGRSGVATITAYSGGATKTLTLNIGSAAATRISVTANPQSLPASGGTSTIAATVGDQQGNPIAGVTVTFSTTAGTIGQTSAVTDANGIATTTITTSATSSAPTVTATAGGGTTGTGLSGTVALTVQPKGTVTLTGPSSATVGVAASFTVGVGTTVPVSNVIIDFGDGDKPFDLGAISASTTISHTYDDVRSYVVSVTAKFVDGTSSTVNTVVVVGDYTATPACPPTEVTFGGASTMSVTVSPAGLSHRVRWDFFGDNTGPQFGSPTTHVWQSRGTKTIQWTVEPTNASSKSGTCQVEVK